MRRRFQFSLRALLLLVFTAAVYAFIAYSIREDHSRSMTADDRRYIERGKDAARREAQQRLKSQEANHP